MTEQVPDPDKNNLSQKDSANSSPVEVEATKPEIPSQDPFPIRSNSVPKKNWKIFKTPWTWWVALKETENTNRVIAIATFVMAFSAVVQVLVTKAQWREMARQYPELRKSAEAAVTAANAAKQSADLERTLAEGNQAAYVMPGNLELFRPNLLLVTVGNTGGISAKSISVEVEVTRQRYPGTHAIGKTQLISFGEDILEAKQTTRPRRYEISEITKLDWQEILHKEETVMFNVTIRYDNGFGTRVQHTWCDEFMSIYGPTANPSPPNNEDCAGVPVRLRQVLPADR